MRAFLLALLLVPGAALANDFKTFTLSGPLPLVAGKDGRCQNARMHPAKPTLPARARTLGQEPPANAYLPVLRLKDGCDVPVMVGENVGGGSGKD